MPLSAPFLLRHFLLVASLSSMAATVQAQCNNGTSGGGAAAPSPGNTATIASMRAGRYAQVTGVAAGANYRATSSRSSDFLTIRQSTPGGTVVASGTQPLDWTSTAAGTYYIHCNTNSSCGTQNTNRSIQLTAFKPAAYLSATTTQASTADALMCAGAHQELLRVQLVIDGDYGTAPITQITVRTNGSTAPLADIAAINIYYTGSTNAFSTATLFGSAAPAAAGTNIPVGGSVNLGPGTHYFWVAYVLASAATAGNAVDAQCTALVVDGTSRAPSVTNPSGNRTIRRCPPAPGGVGNNILLWLRADENVSTSGVNVTAWGDHSTKGSSTVVNGSPDLVGVGRNYNPVILFTKSNGTSGGDFLKLPDLEVQSYFMTAQLQDITREATHIVTYDGVSSGLPCAGCAPHGGGDGTSRAKYGEYGYGRAKFQSAGVWRRNGNSTGITYNTEHSGNFEQVTALGTGQAAVNTAWGGQNSLGPFNGRYRDWLGPVGELILYGSAVTTAETNRIESYLAVKYGITLGNNGSTTLAYRASNNAVLWPADSGYHNDVIGIGRDDTSDLVQKQSRTEDDSTRLYIGALAASNQANTGTFGSDLSYLLAGHNAGKLCSTDASLLEMPTGIYSRLEREWKVVNTGFAGNFNFSIRLNACAIPGMVNPSDLRLLVDLDGNFTNATVHAAGGGLSFSYSGGFITVSGISNTQVPQGSTRYLTIASASPATPLPIELVAFGVQCHGSSVDLDWTTASERNNAFFTVEGSLDGIVFQALATVPGTVNSSSMQHYAWSGTSPGGTVHYYRLRQTDLDGTSTLSDVVAAHCAQETGITLFPNPAHGEFFFQLPQAGNTDLVQVELHTSSGQVAYRHTYAATDGTLHRVPLNGLAPGLYYATITQGSQVGSYKLSVAE